MPSCWATRRAANVALVACIDVASFKPNMRPWPVTFVEISASCSNPVPVSFASDCILRSSASTRPGSNCPIALFVSAFSVLINIGTGAFGLPLSPKIWRTAARAPEYFSIVWPARLASASTVSKFMPPCFSRSSIDIALASPAANFLASDSVFSSLRCASGNLASIRRSCCSVVRSLKLLSCSSSVRAILRARRRMVSSSRSVWPTTLNRSSADMSPRLCGRRPSSNSCCCIVATCPAMKPRMRFTGARSASRRSCPIVTSLDSPSRTLASCTARSN